MTHSLYEKLGVSKDASPEQVKNAYKKLAIQHHPDKGGDIEKFKEISAAYDTLSDADKRRNYDQTGDESGLSGGMGHEFNPHDIFTRFFRGGGNPFEHMGMQFEFQQHFGGGGGGHRGTGGQRRADHRHDIHIQLKDAYFGIHKSVKVSLTKVCFTCLTKCPQCQGLGNITEIHRNGPFTHMSQRQCNVCNGRGKVGSGVSSCKRCGGNCTYTEDVKFELEIEPGTRSGKSISAPGLGEQPQQEGDIAGNLILQIIVDEDHHFKRINEDLEYRTSITFTESVVGKLIDIPHFTGTIRHQIAQFGIIRPNYVYKIKSKGMPPSGDLHVLFDISYPTQVLDDDQRNLIQSIFNDLQL
jgi:DnaJ-class molecular chaperone